MYHIGHRNFILFFWTKGHQNFILCFLFKKLNKNIKKLTQIPLVQDVPKEAFVKKKMYQRKLKYPKITIK